MRGLSDHGWVALVGSLPDRGLSTCPDTNAACALWYPGRPLSLRWAHINNADSCSSHPALRDPIWHPLLWVACHMTGTQWDPVVGPTPRGFAPSPVTVLADRSMKDGELADNCVESQRPPCSLLALLHSCPPPSNITGASENNPIFPNLVIPRFHIEPQTGTLEDPPAVCRAKVWVNDCMKRPRETGKKDGAC